MITTRTIRSTVELSLLPIICSCSTRGLWQNSVACLRTLYTHLFFVNKRQYATPIKQATFHVARQLGKNLISLRAIITRVCRSIRQANSFLARPKNKLLQIDLWNQFALTANRVSALSVLLSAIKGRSATVIIALGFLNACTIASLIAQYADKVKDATRILTLWLHADIAAGGMHTVKIHQRIH